MKNGVVGINANTAALAIKNTQTVYFAGKSTAVAVSAATLISAGSGYLVGFSVVVAGAAGTINNSATLVGASSANAIVATPATVGNYLVGARFTAGLVVSPGAGQTVTVTYSLD
jgi:hypothetical protein